MGFFEALWALIVQLHVSAFAGIFTLPIIGLLLFLYLIFIDVCLIASPFVILGPSFKGLFDAVKAKAQRLSPRVHSLIERIKSRKRVRERLSELDALMPRIETCLEAQDALLNIDNRNYLMKREWDGLLDSVRDIRDLLASIPEKMLSRHGGIATIELFTERCDDEGIVAERNARFKEHELAACNAMLSDIDGKSLDAQQRDAVVTDEYSNLVIAGAGSGKTLTVVGKIKYLVERKGVRPENILVTSFTRKSVLELAERIERAGIEGVSCRNFHQIGLGRLGKVGVAEDWELSRCVLGYLKKGILSHPDQMSAYLEFYGCYRHLPKAYEDCDSEGNRMAELKSEDLTTLKGQLAIAGGRLETFQGEHVKSVEELMIANFLFLHGVAYEYERNYSGDYDTEGRAYQPDFYLPDYGIWLEHFGVNERGRCPQWPPIEEKKYIEGMQWKREVHKTNGTRLIESYSWWNRDNGLLDRLQKLLEENGVEFAEDGEMLTGIYAGIGEDDRYLKSIGSLVETFLSLVKANDLTMDEVEERGRDAYRSDGYLRHRFELFMTFASPIMARYQQMLEEKSKVDFDDMINKAAALIVREGTPESYSHIIVDEYQDISKSRFGLIKAVRDACGARLMCVGDDWQSIYRFAGSDVSLFTEFGDYVGYHKAMKIERTYRNSQELVDAASAFIEENPAQISKEMRSRKHQEMPIIVGYEESMAVGLMRALDSILSTRDEGASSILVLGRHNFDISSAFPALREEDFYEDQYFRLRRDRETGDVHIEYRGYGGITFMSVHRAKGLEADDVVVLNLRNDMYGFPNRIQDDPILKLLIGKADDFEFAEERRLFYVAITRTKRRTYLVAGAQGAGCGPSPFIDDIREVGAGAIGIFEAGDEEDPVLCPKCGTGRLVVRQNKQTGEEFLGCSNWPYCDRSYHGTEVLSDRLRCPKCGGWMVRQRRKRDGRPFFGCSNWPACDGIIDIEDSGINIEEFDRTPEEDAPAQPSYIPARNAELAVDDTVEHDSFGTGTVTVANGGAVIVRFADPHGEKKLLKDYAPMRKVVLTASGEAR